MSKAERSRHMSLVRGRDTRLELEFFKMVSAALYPMGFRYRKHCRNVFGTPDLVFAKFKLAVFVDSDFWHGRNYATLADRMTPFWREKIERNMWRDRQVNRKLRAQGWIVLRFGERQVKKKPVAAVERIKRQLMTRRPNTHPRPPLPPARPLRGQRPSGRFANLAPLHLQEARGEDALGGVDLDRDPVVR